MINIRDTIFDIVRSTNIQYIKLSHGAYFPFAPADADIVKGNYFPINFLKNEIVGYIKHKYNNTWLYGNLKQKYGIFLPIHKDTYSLTNANKQPTLCWLQYLCKGIFVIYRTYGYGLEKIDFLKYIKAKDKTKDDDIMLWVKNMKDATKFTYDPFTHEDVIHNNRLGSCLYYRADGSYS